MFENGYDKYFFILALDLNASIKVSITKKG